MECFQEHALYTSALNSTCWMTWRVPPVHLFWCGWILPFELLSVLTCSRDFVYLPNAYVLVSQTTSYILNYNTRISSLIRVLCHIRIQNISFQVSNAICFLVHDHNWIVVSQDNILIVLDMYVFKYYGMYSIQIPTNVHFILFIFKSVFPLVL